MMKISIWLKSFKQNSKDMSINNIKRNNHGG